MPEVNIRKTALAWFNQKYANISEPILTSKFYTNVESWSKSKVWFFQIPLEFIEPNKIKYLHFLCENHLTGDAFIYLKVPTFFLLVNDSAFEISKKDKVMRIYLSAEAANMFKEVRKGSNIDFSKYIQQ